MLIVKDRSGNGMGIGFVYRAMLEDEVIGTGRTESVRVLGEFNASLQGSFVASFQLVRSFDGGITYSPLTALGTSIVFTSTCQELFEESEPGVLYAWECISYTSGTAIARISQ